MKLKFTSLAKVTKGVLRKTGAAFDEKKNNLPTLAVSDTGNIARIEGRMDFTIYQQILNANVLQLVKKTTGQ